MKLTDELNQKEALIIDHLLTQLRKRFGEINAFLFGSKATGNFSEYSDIDIYIIFLDYKPDKEFQKDYFLRKIINYIRNSIAFIYEKTGICLDISFTFSSLMSPKKRKEDIRPVFEGQIYWRFYVENQKKPPQRLI